MLNIRTLEFHVAHGCNLSCQQCSHYSNLRLKGHMATLEEAESQYEPWSKRLSPGIFAILGGEPCLNPQLCEHVELARRMFPTGVMMLVTNGLLLGRHPDLGKVCAENNVRIEVSRHGPTYQDEFDKARHWIAKWRDEHPSLITHVRQSQRLWMRQYKVKDGKPVPYNTIPGRAYKVCMQRTCTQLFEGNLWKCPAIAYFRMMEEKTGIQDSKEWQLFRDYKSIPPDCSELELREFLIHKAIPQCSLCPASRVHFQHPNPTEDHGIG